MRFSFSKKYFLGLFLSHMQSYRNGKFAQLTKLQQSQKQLVIKFQLTLRKYLKFQAYFEATKRLAKLEGNSSKRLQSHLAYSQRMKEEQKAAPLESL